MSVPLFMVNIFYRQLQFMMLTWLKLIAANVGQTFKQPLWGETAKL